nr:uncharacterized protein LOC103437023 [Malus domestica]
MHPLKRAKAMIFIRCHLDEGLKCKYITVKDPVTLSDALRNIYNHQKTVILPKGHYKWTYLRIQDFKTVAEYNSTVSRISSRMKLCGEAITEEDMLEKTLSTFHVSNVLLQQQYREKEFIEYNQLISVLLVIEQNNELLMKNHQSRLIGLTPFSEVNSASLKKNTTFSHSNNYRRRRGHK